MAAVPRFRNAALALLILAACALPYFAIVQGMERPFALHDDAYWLLPSLAHDGALPFAEQLRRDVGERGAHSLNAYLRVVLATQGLNPRHHALTGVALHLLGCWLFFMVLAQRGVDRVAALVAAMLMLGASQAFHAWVWVIAHQHLLSLAFIFLALGVTHRLERSFDEGSRSGLARTAWLIGMTAFLLVASLNRLSALFVGVAWWLSFSRILPATSRRERAFGWILFTLGIATLWLYPAQQLVSGQEGWQVSQFAHRLLRRLPGAFAEPSALQLVGLVVLASAGSLAAWIHLPFRRWRGRFPGNTPSHWAATVLALGLLFLVLHPDRLRFAVLPSVLANLLFLPPESFLEERWFPVTHPLRESALASAAVALLFFAGLWHLLRRLPEAALALCATLIAMATVSLLYFETLAQAPLSLRDLPSRYVTYLLPLVSLVLAVAIVDGVRAALRRVGPGLALAASGVPVLAALAFVIGGQAHFHTRLDHMLRYDLKGLESREWPVTEILAAIERRLADAHATTIPYLRDSVPRENFHPFIANFVPPADSPHYPRIANLQAMIRQRPDARHASLQATDSAQDALRFSAFAR